MHNSQLLEIIFDRFVKVCEEYNKVLEILEHMYVTGLDNTNFYRVGMCQALELKGILESLAEMISMEDELTDGIVCEELCEFGGKMSAFIREGIEKFSNETKCGGNHNNFNHSFNKPNKNSHKHNYVNHQNPHTGLKNLHANHNSQSKTGVHFPIDNDTEILANLYGTLYVASILPGTGITVSLGDSIKTICRRANVNSLSEYVRKYPDYFISIPLKGIETSPVDEIDEMVGNIVERFGNLFKFGYSIIGFVDKPKLGKPSKLNLIFCFN